MTWFPDIFNRRLVREQGDQIKRMAAFIDTTTHNLEMCRDSLNFNIERRAVDARKIERLENKLLKNSGWVGTKKCKKFPKSAKFFRYVGDKNLPCDSSGRIAVAPQKAPLKPS